MGRVVGHGTEEVRVSRDWLGWMTTRSGLRENVPWTPVMSDVAE